MQQFIHIGTEMRAKSCPETRFYQQIVAALSGPLDADLFELCVPDLLQEDFPSVVPVRGGSDSGMDGAIADGNGVAYPLVVTTGTDVSDNLTKNLKKYLEDNGPRRRVVFATSQKLTPLRQRNLEAKAATLGFELVQIYEQTAIADRLYRQPRWCKDLLGLIGIPPALSTIPLTTRPLRSDPLLGREDDLAWLKNQAGDRLLVGQPGSGKTSLLYALALQDWGLFLNDHDRTHLANALRERSPSVVIVDDAHIRPQILVELRQLRNALDAQFAIVVTCWPNAKDHVTESLGITSSQIRELDLLTRDQIAEIVRNAGVDWHDGLIQEIVEQAQGAPGLAVTLADLVLRGGGRDVVLGEAVARNLRQALAIVLDDESTSLLAALALGGDRGFVVEDVARTLDIPLYKARGRLAALAFAGVLRERTTLDDKSCLSIWPSAFRHILIRDEFFGGTSRLSIERFITSEMLNVDVAETLVFAKGVGAQISSALLQETLKSVNSTSVWEAYASLGPDETRWVIEHHPHLISSIASVVLIQTPELVLPHLLANAVVNISDQRHNASHPMRLIEQWIEVGEP